MLRSANETRTGFALQTASLLTDAEWTLLENALRRDLAAFSARASLDEPGITCKNGRGGHRGEEDRQGIASDRADILFPMSAIERIDLEAVDAVMQTSQVHVEAVGMGPGTAVRMDSTDFAESMLSNPGVESIATEVLIAT